MPFSNAISKTRIPFTKNYLMIACLLVFLTIWLNTLISTTDLKNWLLENFLVFLFLGFLLKTYKKNQFSDLSYMLITIYLCLHIYGSKYTYAENPFGYWLKDTFNYERNPYDRLVHFCFGFLLAYPLREVFISWFKFPAWVGWALPIEITLSVSGLYELIEWGVADILFPEQGAAYLGSQGDYLGCPKRHGFGHIRRHFSHKYCKFCEDCFCG